MRQKTTVTAPSVGEAKILLLEYINSERELEEIKEKLAVEMKPIIDRYGPQIDALELEMKPILDMYDPQMDALKETIKTLRTKIQVYAIKNKDDKKLVTALKKMGILVSQDETFFIEPKEETVA